MSTPYDLSGRTYVLTGSSKGLGFATAEVLVGLGANVVVTGRDRAALDVAVEQLGAEHAVGVAADNADPDAPRAMVAAAREHFGGIDGLLVSVGGPPGGRVGDVTDDQWRDAFDAVFLGAVRIVREIAPELGEGGSIALVLSSSVRAPIGGLAISNGLRPGLAMLVKDLADDLGPRGIRINALLPARIDTERVRYLDGLSGDAAAQRATNERSIPLGRYGRPEEFGAAAAFLLSPAAAYITGTMLPVDGGAIRGL
ncbi:SDR family oxidoreductase [Mumia zhuanghuii]|uniref:SDR family oxidoreductase n=2 Tax=Mumia TaxID=1546255 RepID=A0ABW1QLB7_9ACTN|nr:MULTISPECIES: SDR family oxidoreductase [Mumia]KAA1419954.1 SDR family oxidoreductase [Mumia zhuanghuii]